MTRSHHLSVPITLWLWLAVSALDKGASAASFFCVLLCIGLLFNLCSVLGFKKSLTSVNPAFHCKCGADEF